MIMIMMRCWLDPSLAPPVEFPDRAALWRERWASLGEIWPIIVLIAGVIGGLYAGVVTPTEGGAVGAFLAMVIGFLRRQLSVARPDRQLQGRDRHHRRSCSSSASAR